LPHNPKVSATSLLPHNPKITGARMLPNTFESENPCNILVANHYDALGYYQQKKIDYYKPCTATTITEK
jgi:hypothetical protein